MTVARAKASHGQPRPQGRAHHTTAWAATELGRGRQRAEGAAWLARVPWQAVASLTFATLPAEIAALAFLRSWLRAVAARLGVHVTYAYGAALDGSAGSHFHVLLAGERAPTSEELRFIAFAWRSRHGFVRVRRYKPARGAEGYVLRHPTWDCGVLCPEPRLPRCRRRRRCPEARRRW